MNSFKKISVNEKGVQMRKLVTAIVVALSVFASAVFAEEIRGNITYIKADMERGTDKRKVFYCELGVRNIIENVIFGRSEFLNAFYYGLWESEQENILKDNEYFEEHKRLKEYLKDVRKELEAFYANRVNEALEIANKYCVLLGEGNKHFTYDDYELNKKIVPLSVAKDTLFK